MNETQKAVNQIYNQMLDNVAFEGERQYMQDLFKRGTAAVSINVYEGKMRHCAIHGCPHCKRVLGIPASPLDQGTWVDGIVVAALIVAGVAVALWLKQVIG